jgi:hypothetical protein
MPVQVHLLSERIGIIHDPRIPDEWYDKRYCEVCCPESLLPFPQQAARVKKNVFKW